MKAETALFGATDTGSAVVIRVSAPSREPKEFTEQISVRIGGTWQATGKGYLLWSMAKSGRVEKNNLKPARWYFLPGTCFRVTLAIRNKDDTKQKQAIAAFWLLTHLGGIGSRSRRCAGSVTIPSPVHEVYGFPFGQPTSKEALKQQIEQGIKAARGLYGVERRTLKEAHFDALAPDACRIWILQDEQPWNSADTAMKEIGERLQSYRGGIAIGRRKIFGLPLMPIIKDRRRASPLLLRVAKLSGNRYVGIAVLFKTVGSDINVSDYTFIEKWVNAFSGKLEVTL